MGGAIENKLTPGAFNSMPAGFACQIKQAQFRKANTLGVSLFSTGVTESTTRFSADNCLISARHGRSQAAAASMDTWMEVGPNNRNLPLPKPLQRLRPPPLFSRYVNRCRGQRGMPQVLLGDFASHAICDGMAGA